MTKTEAHELLNAAKAGLMVSSQSITEALVVTGDLLPCQRHMQELIEVTHAVPAFERTPFEPMPEKRKPERYVPKLPALVHKPFALSAHERLARHGERTLRRRRQLALRQRGRLQR